MTVIETIREKVRLQQYEFAIPHFFEEMADDDLIFADIELIHRVDHCHGPRPSSLHARPVR